MTKAKDKKDASVPETKTFSLMAPEANLLKFLQEHTQAIMSGYLSTIAMQRLGYTVTPFTQFQINETFTEMQLTEMPAPPEAQAAGDGNQQPPQAPPQAPAASDESPVVPAK